MKKKIYILLLVLLVSISSKILAQQDPQYTQYIYNMTVMNPAYAGSKEGISLGLLARSQWVGVSGAPKTFSGFIHSPVSRKVGLGLSLIHDKIGPVSETHAYADFSFTINTSEKAKLAFGLKAGATFQQIGLLTLNQVESNDSKFNQNSNKTYPNFGVGAFYYKENFYVGASIPNLLETLHFERSNGKITKASEKMHGFLTAGYVIDLKNRFKLKPSALVKYADSAPLSLDLSLNLLWNNKVEFGVSHRLDDSWSGIVNFRIGKDLRLGYAYDHTISNLGEFSSGSHEFLLLFDFKSEEDSYKQPRFF
ncbi:PorP/SprF family type IX secretion system membrane protein [Tenacibaculum discolor]|nr:type IX secretion system membrane protein PorP/SprF [Tenacibaculum discolor]MDP2541322.1 type IX secretion system membrane protein PorP/SprF [Tenacibaculum discolor]